MSHPWFAGPGSPRILAHRGLSTPAAVAPGVAENSRASVIAALSAGASYVESDCHLTADGVAVLFHDDNLERITGDHRLIADVTARELDRMMIERGGLLTLADALADFPDARWNLDVKAEAAAVPVGTLVAPHAVRTLVTSFSDRRRHAALSAAMGAGAAIRPATSAGSQTLARILGALSTRVPALIRRSLGGIDAVQIPERHGRIRVLSPRLITAAHAAGVEVHVWTVNEPERMSALVALGVDGLVTDRADLAIRLFRGSPGAESTA